MSTRSAAHLLLALTLGSVLAVVGLTLVHLHAPALVVGTVVGAFFLLRGMAHGGGLGNVRGVGQKPADVSTRVGVCLAAAGIASASLGHDNPPFPPPFRVFYGLCLVLACVGAVFLAVKSARSGTE